MAYPAGLDFEGPVQVRNWRPLVNWVLGIPQILIVYALRALRQVLLLIAFFSILFTKKIPRPLFDTIVMIRRYRWRVITYLLWMRESYAPFDFTPGATRRAGDPASLFVRYPAELNRWLPLVKWFLAIPHYIVLAVLYAAAVVVGLIVFFAVLFTGKWPQGLRDFLVGVARWSLRVKAYVGFLRDEYPPFSLS
jgi:hypothetical protein